MNPLDHNARCELRRAQACAARAQHVHHRKLRKHGGGDDVENLLWVCLNCHDHIHRNPAEAYENGWLVHPWDDPADIPVVYPQAA